MRQGMIGGHMPPSRRRDRPRDTHHGDWNQTTPHFQPPDVEDYMPHRCPASTNLAVNINVQFSSGVPEFVSLLTPPPYTEEDPPPRDETPPPPYCSQDNLDRSDGPDLTRANIPGNQWREVQPHICSHPPYLGPLSEVAASSPSLPRPSAYPEPPSFPGDSRSAAEITPRSSALQDHPPGYYDAPTHTSLPHAQLQTSLSTDATRTPSLEEMLARPPRYTDREEACEPLPSNTDDDSREELARCDDDTTVDDSDVITEHHSEPECHDSQPACHEDNISACAEADGVNAMDHTHVYTHEDERDEHPCEEAAFITAEEDSPDDGSSDRQSLGEASTVSAHSASDAQNESLDRLFVAEPPVC